MVKYHVICKTTLNYRRTELPRLSLSLPRVRELCEREVILVCVSIQRAVFNKTLLCRPKRLGLHGAGKCLPRLYLVFRRANILDLVTQLFSFEVKRFCFELVTNLALNNE